MESESPYSEGEEQFGPIRSFLYSLMTPFMRKYHNAIIEDLKGKKFSKLLDVGCGPGNIVARLSAIKPSAQFFCVDPSPGMRKIAQKNFDEIGLGSRVILRSGSSRDIPFDERFEAIISTLSYHHWQDRDSSLKNLTNYLTEDGFLTIYEFDNDFRWLKSSHGVSEKEWKSLNIEGLSKTVEHRKGVISLTLTK